MSVNVSSRPIAAILMLTCLAQAAGYTASRSGIPSRTRAHRAPPSKTAGAVRRPPAPRRLPAGARGPDAPSGRERTALEISDLKSQQHASTVEAALQQVTGVHSAIVDLKTGLAVVDYDPRTTRLERFILACRGAGFAAAEYRVEDRFPKPIKLKGG